MSLGGSSSKNKSSSESSGFGYGLNQSTTRLDPQQQANQQQLVNRYFSGAMPAVQNAMQGFDYWRQNALQGAQGLQNQMAPFISGLQQSAGYGRDALQQFSQQNNPYLNSQIHGLAQDFGQLYREQILPGIGADAQLAGQRGSSRQGIAEALGAQRTAQEFGQSALALRNQAYTQQQQAARDLAIMGQQGALQGYGQQGQLNSAQGALANEFTRTGLQGALSPFQIGAGVIGAPSILSDSYGLDYREQQSKSKGTGSSGGLSVGFI